MQRLFALPIKSTAQGNKNNFLFVGTAPSFAFKIQTDFNAAGVKTPAPIEGFARFEVVPLKTHPGAAHAAMHLPLPRANRLPYRAFCEHRQQFRL